MIDQPNKGVKRYGFETLSSQTSSPIPCHQKEEENAAAVSETSPVKSNLCSHDLRGKNWGKSETKRHNQDFLTPSVREEAEAFWNDGAVTFKLNSM